MLSFAALRLQKTAPFLLLTEGHTVGTLVYSGVGLVGAYQDTLQGAEVCIAAMMCALGYGTLNALICMAIHDSFLLSHRIWIV